MEIKRKEKSHRPKKTVTVGPTRPSSQYRFPFSDPSPSTPGTTLTPQSRPDPCRVSHSGHSRHSLIRPESSSPPHSTEKNPSTSYPPTSLHRHIPPPQLSPYPPRSSSDNCRRR
ncbi:hypothetical protein V8G54_030091 [Vigna mungo]|uniref:Uncharacterized protein n=1 Tax=Vigna mungo TaxID=3915 RepID=A0AAQ3MVI7_VIGMU